MTNRKPRVNPLVPTRDVDRWLGRIHVATPDEQVVSLLTEIMARANFEAQCPQDMTAAQKQRWANAIRRQTVRYALWRHAQNYLAFARVMGSHA